MLRTDFREFMKAVELDEQKDINELTYVKTPEQIKTMKEAGAIAAKVFSDLDQHIKVGATTRELHDVARAYIKKHHAAIDRVNFLNEHNIEQHESISIMRNHTIYNELPDDKLLKFGDTINIDISLKKEGWCADTSKMWIIGHECSSLHRRLLAVAYEAMWVGIRMVKAGLRTGDLRYTVQKYVESQGFSMIRGPFTGGHSIGKKHMDGLYIPFWDGKPNTGHVLQEGHVISIEPFICTGTGETEMSYVQAGDETIAVCSLKEKTQRAAYWEHVVAVTKDGCEILDLRPGEVFE